MKYPTFGKISTLSECIITEGILSLFPDSFQVNFGIKTSNFHPLPEDLDLDKITPRKGYIISMKPKKYLPILGITQFPYQDEMCLAPFCLRKKGEIEIEKKFVHRTNSDVLQIMSNNSFNSKLEAKIDEIRDIEEKFIIGQRKFFMGLSTGPILDTVSASLTGLPLIPIFTGYALYKHFPNIKTRITGPSKIEELYGEIAKNLILE